MKVWPAIDVRDPGDSDLLLLALDDYQVTALEPRGVADDGEIAHDVRVFFSDAGHRDQALAGLAPEFQARPVDVPDEDWARRSQQQLAPVAVGRITVYPTLELFHDHPLNPGSRLASGEPLPLLIPPSMGFGTGPHATTRLCLAALQTMDLTDRSVLDVGTGSGVLALAARLLGAGQVVGLDYDADAIQSAEENRVLNHASDRIRFEIGDFRPEAGEPKSAPLDASAALLVDLVIANLTGAVLTQYGGDLLARIRTGGTLIISGVQVQERGEVFSALAAARLVWESEEDGWIGAVFMRQDVAEA
jgi:ribosomal protein L11 methyltransferase